MRRLWILGLFAALCPALAQNPGRPRTRADMQRLEKRCRLLDKEEDVERRAATDYKSPQLAQALGSWETLWAFLHNPGTPYMARLAAADQGVALATPEHLPTLWDERHRNLGGPVLLPSPCAILHPGRAIDWNAMGTKPTDYPVTAGERAKGPWQWQLTQALTILQSRLHLHYSDPIRYRRLVEQTWNYEPADYGALYDWFSVVGSGPRNADWLKTMVRIGLSKKQVAGAGVAELDAPGSYRGGGYHMEELTHVAHITVLMNIDDARHATLAAYLVGRMAHDDFSKDSGLKQLRTATGLLAVARWAMNAKVDDWTRYYGFVKPAMQMLDSPPVRFDVNLNTQDPAVHRALVVFEEWFREHEQELQMDATRERPGLVALAKELAEANPDDWPMRF